MKRIACRLALAASLLGTSLVAAGCASTNDETVSSAYTVTGIDHLPGPSSTAPRVTKVVVFVVENHSVDQMKTSMPKVYALANTYAYASDYVAIRHPSLPNYLAMAGGSTFGVTDDKGPSAHPISGASVFSQARAAGKTAKIYADAMPSNCYLSNAGTYAVRHNPWTYFVDGRTGCKTYDQPIALLAADASNGTMPNVAFVIPDLNHDAHDASLATSDAWIGKQIDTIKAGPDWQSGRLAIIVTADEDDRNSGNRVLTVVASKYQRHGVVSRHLTHYSLTRFIDDVLHAPYLRNAASAPSMTGAFGVKVN
jgi:phospholipase C